MLRNGALILLGLAALGVGVFFSPRLFRTADSGESAMTAQPKRIIFVCIENSNRSQMAEAFARIHGGPGIEAYSAGSRPSGRVNPKAIESMKEHGYDLTTHRSKGLDGFSDMEFDVAVTMGCGDDCPNLRTKRRVDWQIPDPKALSPDEFREVRNLIESKVRELLASLR